MANFLGSRYCIESLLHDIKDIEVTIGDVNSRIGQDVCLSNAFQRQHLVDGIAHRQHFNNRKLHSVKLGDETARIKLSKKFSQSEDKFLTMNYYISALQKVKYQSWKFPDRLSIDVDVESLLIEHQYNKDADEEDKQASHVMLYDLLIDRLLFLLQSITHFNEMLLSLEFASDRGGSPGKGMKSVSAGLTAKRCWSRITQVAASMQQLAKLVENAKHTTTELLNDPTIVKSNYSIKDVEPAEDHQEMKRCIQESHNRSSQTDVTTYISCEICSRSQLCLYDVGKSVVKVCKSQGLPTSLEDYITKQSLSSLLSIAELSRWKNLQMKDLSRIDRHMESLIKTIAPLKKELEDANKRREEDKSEIQRIKMLTDRRIDEISQQQNRREHEMLESEKSLRIELTALNGKNQSLQDNVSALKLELSEMKNELMEKHKLFLAAENQRLKLEAEVMECRQYKEDAMRMRNESVELRRKVNANEDKLFSIQAKLEKESNKTRTMQSHEQALQDKQRGILQRFAELTEECEEWRERATLAEDENEKMVETIEERRSRKKADQEVHFDKDTVTMMEEEKVSLQRRIADLQSSIDVLEERLQSCTERERLLVFYPDLHKSHHLTAVESSGDVCTDMRRQVEANQLRMEVLERENQELMKTLSKLPPPDVSTFESKDNPQGVKLWKSFSESPDSNHEMSPEMDISFQFLTGAAQGESSKKIYQNRSPVSSRHKQHGVETRKNEQASPTRTSFSVGPGKRRTNTPTSSRPSSGRSALVKPWT